MADDAGLGIERALGDAVFLDAFDVVVDDSERDMVGQVDVVNDTALDDEGDVLDGDGVRKIKGLMGERAAERAFAGGDFLAGRDAFGEVGDFFEATAQCRGIATPATTTTFAFHKFGLVGCLSGWPQMGQPI